MSLQGERLASLLDQLERHQVSLADAVKQVRTATFPAAPARGAYGALADDANGDPRIPEDSSFFQIAAAYTEGRINRVAYDALAEAAAQAIKGHSEQRDSDGRTEPAGQVAGPAGRLAAGNQAQGGSGV